MRNLGLVIALICSFARWSSGATIVGTARFETVPADPSTCPPTSLCQGSAPSPVVLHGVIQPFDPSLGVLQSVAFGGYFGGSGSAYSNVYIDTPGDYSFNLDWKRILAAPDNSILAEIDWMNVGNAWRVHATEPGYYLVTEGNSLGLWQPVLTGNLDVFTAPNGSFSFTLDFRFRRSLGFSGPEEDRYFAPDYFNGWAYGATSVIYEYSPVPEPGTAWLVALGLAVLGLRPRRLTVRP